VTRGIDQIRRHAPVYSRAIRVASKRPSTVDRHTARPMVLIRPTALTALTREFYKRRECSRRGATLLTPDACAIVESSYSLLSLVLLPAVALATPSTTYWAPSVATCQAKYVPHVTYDTYYGKGTPPPGSGAPTYPIDGTGGKRPAA